VRSNLDIYVFITDSNCCTPVIKMNMSLLLIIPVIKMNMSLLLIIPVIKMNMSLLLIIPVIKT
jgi:hypothetical protein